MSGKDTQPSGAWITLQVFEEFAYRVLPQQEHMSSLRDNSDWQGSDVYRRPFEDGPARGMSGAGASAGLSPGGLTARERLLMAMGLTFDPFSSGVTERDLAPDFGKVYVDLLPSLLQDLQRPGVSVVLGDYGMGKTATRLALEFALRQSRSPRTLCVTYTPQVKDQTGPGLRSQHKLDAADGYLRLVRHVRAITQAASIDLLVQLVERTPQREPEAPGLQTRLWQQALSRQARAAARTIAHPLRQALRSQGADGVFWRGLRPVVGHVAPDNQWREFVQLIAQACAEPGDQEVTWEETLYDARALGFEQIFVLIDAIDDGTIDAASYFGAVQPLLAVSSELQKQGVYLKCFMPLSVKGDLEDLVQTYFHSLTPPINLATIDAISDTNLHRLIDERLVAASTTMGGWYRLDRFGQELEESVQEWLVSAAGGSPRRLMELVNALLDFQSLRGFRDHRRLWLTPEEWTEFREAVEGRGPPP